MRNWFLILFFNLTLILQGQGTVSVGAGTSNVYRYPFYGYYDYGHTMFIYTQSEIGASKRLDQIEFDIAGYTGGYTFNNVTIKLAHTTDDEFGTNIKVDLTNLAYSDLTTVVNSQNITISSSGWLNISFSTTFDYNGTDNLLIIIENRDGSWASGYGYSENEFDNCSCSNDYMSWYKFADNSYPTGYGTRDQSYRPNIKVGYSELLPVELIYLKGESLSPNKNIIKWATASELNNDYFEIKVLNENNQFITLDIIDGNGTTTSYNEYTYIHENVKQGLNTYLIKQIDFDGNSETFTPIIIENLISNPEILRIINSLGQEVSEDYPGIIYKIYNNGKVDKIYNN
jgi:hypothetical protein